VRYSARIARWIAEREHVSLAPDGSLTLDHPLADTEWAVRHVLQYGPDAEVIAPVEVREQIRTRLASILA
jgi:predicted DNA-binding transcriptional regulator YafY